MKKFKIWRSLILTVVFLPACLGGTSGPSPVDTGGEIACHDFDVSSTLAFNFKGQGIKEYVLVKKGAQITEVKINEGKFLEGTYNPGPSRIRKVGRSEPPKIHDIYWLDRSYKSENTEDFIFAFQEIMDKGNYLFDIYGDAEKFSSAADLPDFIKNCQLEGGGNLVPIDDPGTAFPPIVLEIKKVNKAGFEANYNKHKDEYTEKYTHDKISPAPPIPNAADQIGIITLDDKGKEKIHNVHYHAGTLYLEDQSDKSKVYQYSGVVGEVTLPAGGDPNLQLRSIKFITPLVWGWWVPECKPAIYLYPEERTELEVKIAPLGTLTQSEPAYEDGWRVTAYSGGEIISEGRRYRHLDYEAQILKVAVPERGFVVERANLASFFDNILPRLGLNGTEIADFKEYWVRRLTRNPYYFVSLLPEEEIERIEPLTLSINPDTFIRVRFYFKGLEEPLEATPPLLEDHKERRGFTVVEWGGVVEDGSACR